MKTKRKKLTKLQKECLQCERINLRRLQPTKPEDIKAEQEFWDARHPPKADS